MDRIAKTQKVDSNFIVAAVDFFRTYADRYHHGKEEGILFQSLSRKELSTTDQKMMFDLSMEHAYARKTVRNLERAKEAYLAGVANALNDIAQYLSALVELYPKHIEKEDNHFFIPVMAYFTGEEQDDMLKKFIAFDQDFTNKKYQQIVEELDAQPK
jgi:hemerythrin-like domain-containing protein